MSCPKLLHSIAKRAYRLRSKPIVAKRLSATWLLDPQNWIDNRLLARAPYEVAQLRHAKELIEKHSLSLFIDVGANIGLYTVLIGKLPQIQKTISFEPMRRNFAQLQANLFLNNLHTTTNTHRLALGSEDGTVNLHIDPHSTGLARIDIAGAERDASVFTLTEEIPITRFDKLETLKNQRIFLKIDAEGHAAAVLEGMKQLFADNHVVAMVELSPTEEEPVAKFFRETAHQLGTRVENDQFYLPNP